MQCSCKSVDIFVSTCCDTHKQVSAVCHPTGILREKLFSRHGSGLLTKTRIHVIKVNPESCQKVQAYAQSFHSFLWYTGFLMYNIVDSWVPLFILSCLEWL